MSIEQLAMHVMCIMLVFGLAMCLIEAKRKKPADGCTRQQATRVTKTTK